MNPKPPKIHPQTGLMVASLRFGFNASLKPRLVSGNIGSIATTKPDAPIPRAQRTDSGSEENMPSGDLDASDLSVNRRERIWFLKTK
jgi:hypothetical protein